jgi:hypothetical protein
MRYSTAKGQYPFEPIKARGAPVTLTTITQVAYTTAAIIKRGMTAATDLLMALSLRGVAIDGKMDVADKAMSFGICCFKRSLIRGKDKSRDGDHMLVGLSSIKLSDLCGV